MMVFGGGRHRLQDAFLHVEQAAQLFEIGVGFNEAIGGSMGAQPGSCGGVFEAAAQANATIVFQAAKVNRQSAVML